MIVPDRLPVNRQTGFQPTVATCHTLTPDYSVRYSRPMVDYGELRSLLSEMGGAVIGYSGGVDSTLLARAANDALGKNAVCVLVESCLMPGTEVEEAVEQARVMGLNLVRIGVDALDIPNVPENAPDRCYHCKTAIFGKLAQIAKERNLPYVLDGSNADDASDYRPGSRATAELGVRSPLKELGLTKDQVRAISRDVGLPTWDKPSFACLASRIPYGTPLNAEVLRRVEMAEDILRKLGLRQFRVRHHGDVARIELMPMDMDRITVPAMRQQVVAEFRKLGYTYAALDLAGYRMGSMNEVLES